MSEHEEQKAVCRYLDARGVKYFSVPNEAKRPSKTTSMLKARGMKRGAPDLVIVTRPPKRSCRKLHVAIEMKASHKEEMSDEQVAMRKGMIKEGWFFITGYGAEDAIEKLKKMLGY